MLCYMLQVASNKLRFAMNEISEIWKLFLIGNLFLHCHDN